MTLPEQPLPIRSSAAKIAFLIGLGAQDIAHSGSTLLGHLRGTHDLLQAWGARPAVCDAGLFHSVYGTSGYRKRLLTETDRSRVRELIGEDAEGLAHLFGAMTFDSFAFNFERSAGFTVFDAREGRWTPLRLKQLQDLANITAANWLDQRPRLPATFLNGERARYDKMIPLLLLPAQAAIRACWNAPAQAASEPLDTQCSSESEGCR